MGALGGPPMIAGTSTFKFPTSECAILTQFRPKPTKAGLLDMNRRRSLVGLGRTLANLAPFGMGSPKHRRPRGTRRPPMGVWNHIVGRFATAWVIKRAIRKGLVKTEPLWTTTLGEPKCSDLTASGVRRTRALLGTRNLSRHHPPEPIDRDRPARGGVPTLAGAPVWQPPAWKVGLNVTDKRRKQAEYRTKP